MTKREFVDWITAIKRRDKATDADLQGMSDDLGYIEILIALVPLTVLERWAGRDPDGPPWITGGGIDVLPEDVGPV